MIQDMGWIPIDFSAQGSTALMRARFSEAVAAFSSQAKVQAAETRRHAVPATPPEVDAAQEWRLDPTLPRSWSHRTQRYASSHSRRRAQSATSSTSPQQTRLVRIAARKKKPVEARLVRTPWISPTVRGTGRSHACGGARRQFYGKLLLFRKTRSLRTSRDWFSPAQLRSLPRQKKW